MYKKKSLQFCNEEFSRAARKSEVFKARESSRFKHLSINREMEKIESVNAKEEKNPRSLMLLKWKQEKQTKKELEMKSKKRPFYVGRYTSNQSPSKNVLNKNLQNMTSSFMDQTNTKDLNSTKIAKNMLINAKSSSQPSRIPNISKQVVTKFSSQSSRIPNILKQASLTQGSANKNDKKIVAKNSVIAQSTIKTSGNSLKKENKLPDPTLKPKCLVPQKPKKPIFGIKEKSVIPVGFQKVSSAQGSANKNDKKIVAKNVFNEKGSIKSNGFSLKTENKLSDPGTKPKGLVPPKVAKLPISNQKLPAPGSSQKESSTKKVISRKGYSFKKAFADSRKQQIGSENSLSEVKTKSEVESLCEQNSVSISDLNCDMSIIKPIRDSFAPVDFQFKPPAGIFDFLFEDEDPDQVLEEIKIKYMTRTSTPSKESSSKCSIESECEKTAAIPLHTSSLIDEEDKLDVKDSEKFTTTPLHINSEVDVKDKLDVKDLSETFTTTPLQIDSEVDVKDKLDVTDSSDKLDIKDSSKTSPTAPMHTPVLKDEKDKLDVKVTEIDVAENPKIASCEKESVIAFEEPSECTDSPLNILDLSKMEDDFEEQLELQKFPDEKIVFCDAFEEPEFFKIRKVSGAPYKRVSMLKSVSTLNAIAEADDNLNKTIEESTEDTQDVASNQCSKKLSISSCLDANVLNEFIPEEDTPQKLQFTPRRSLRLQKVAVTTPLVSPLKKQKSVQRVGLRRSLRLIELNTPIKGEDDPQCSKSNLTADFQKLQLDESENMNPDAFLIDFESSPGLLPIQTSQLKSRKVSLLYTPENRRLTRKSIRGDLISFSPSS